MQHHYIKYTIIVLATINEQSNQLIKLTIEFDSHSTVALLKEAIHELLLESKYQSQLSYPPSHYNEMGVRNDYISPHDLFEIDDDDLLIECIGRNQTIYLYHQSYDFDSCLIQNYKDYHFDAHTAKQKEEEEEDPDEDEDDDIKDELEREKKQKQKEKLEKESNPFFNSINLYFAYAGKKYGIGEDLNENITRTQLVQISHAILIWALRKMDDLWQQKSIQNKLEAYLGQHGYNNSDIINICKFGNALNDENALFLLRNSPWMVCEPNFEQKTYDLLDATSHSRDSSSNSWDAINKEQQKQNEESKGDDNNYSADHPLLHQGDDSFELPTDHRKTEDSLTAAFNQIKKDKGSIEIGPRRWPPAEGHFIYWCQFLHGTCTQCKYDEYLRNLGKDFALNHAQINYLLLLWETEQNLAKSLWEFAELEL